MTRQDTDSPASATRFFDWVRGTQITRTDDRWLAGVCGGVARQTGLDPLVVRGVAIVVALLGGPVFLFYAAGWALLPDTAGRIHVERVLRGVVDPAIVAIGVLVVLTFVPAVRGLWWQGVPVAWGMPDWLAVTLGTAWTIALAGCAVWLVVVLARRRSTTDDDGPGGERAGTGAGPGTVPGAGASVRRDFWTSADVGTDRTTGAGWPAGVSRASWTGEDGSGAGEAGPTRASWTTDPAGAADRQRQHQERLRADRERRAERSRRQAERQPGAGFVAVSVGLALVLGAGVAVWAQQAGLPVLVLGIATALAVLAVATVVAGIRGRESGALGLFSTIGVVGLVLTGVLPAGTQITAVGGSTWRVDDVTSGSERNFAMVVGGPAVDLRGLDEADGGGRVNLWLGAGGADVLLPTDAPVRVEVSGIGYGVDVTPGRNDDDGQGGVLGTTVVENQAARGARADETTTVHVWVLGGGVDVPGAAFVDERGAGR